jgi:hypothetical protein
MVSGGQYRKRAADAIPHEEFSILLSHTPEIYRQAAHAGFDCLFFLGSKPSSSDEERLEPFFGHRLTP